MKRIYPHPFFAREGWPFMAAFFLLAFVVDCFVDGIIAFFFWLLFLFVANFFRDPVREMTEEANAVVSPVDGRVVKIEEAVCPYTGKKMRMISIFMNVFNVHSQKAPVAGTVTKVEYFKGKFFNAALDKASTDNERNAVVVKTHAGDTVCFVQIAGLVARRILCYTHVGDVLARASAAAWMCICPLLPRFRLSSAIRSRALQASLHVLRNRRYKHNAFGV